MDLNYASLHVGRSIVASSIGSSGISLVDNTPTLYKYSQEANYEKHRLLKGFKSYINRYGKIAATSDDGKHFILCDSQSNRVLFFNLQTMSLMAQVKFPKTPDFCTFSHDSRYFAIANIVGRFAFYDIDSKKVQGELQLSDGISAVTFSDDSTKIAIATLDKKVYLFDVEKNNIQSVFSMEEIVEVLSFGKNLTNIVAFTRAGETFVIKHLIDKITMADPCSEWPTTSAHQENSAVTLIGTRSNEIYIYTSSNGDKLGSMTFEHWGVTSISVFELKVFLGFSDGHGIIFDLKPHVSEAIKALDENNCEKLSLLVAEFPLIFVHAPLCEKIQERYLDIFEYKAITHEEKIGLEALISLIISSSGNKRSLLAALYSSPSIVPFMESMDEGNFENACSVADDSPLLRQLREFTEIRTTCLMELKEEMRILETNPAKLIQHVESMPARCRECSHGILPNVSNLEESYTQLLSSANARNFPVAMEIVKKYPVLKQTRIYRRLINYGEAFIDKTLIMIAAERMEEAEKYATNLTRIKPFAFTGMDFLKQIKAYATFKQACEKNDLTKIFSLVSEHAALRTTDKFNQQLAEHKHKVLDAALFYVKVGDVINVQKIIAPYSQIEYFEEKYFELMKSALVNEIKIYAPMGEEHSLLNRYHDRFGWDESYEEACEALSCLSNKLVKIDVETHQYKDMVTFLTGEKHKRKYMENQNEHEQK